jgi:hypothetical protein
MGLLVAGFGSLGCGESGGSSDSSFARLGSVEVSQWSGQTAIAAVFREVDPRLVCSGRDEGPCRIADCSSPKTGGAAAPGTAPSHRPLDAGRITITSPLRSAVLEPDDRGTYVEEHRDVTAIWQPGQAVDVAATGGAVPAFSGRLVGPEPVQLISPRPTSLPLNISRDTDLLFAWTGGGAGEVAITFSSSGNYAVQVTCRFPALSGMGTVNRSVLALVPPGDGEIRAESLSHQNLDRGGWRLGYSLISAATFMPAGDSGLMSRFE